MTIYELYAVDDMGGDELIGILPERRKNLQRITSESIIN